MAHVHTQDLVWDRLTIVEQCEMIDVEMAEIEPFRSKEFRKYVIHRE